MANQNESMNDDDTMVDEDSFADQINTTKLKRLQLQPFEFCLMILSSSVSSMPKSANLRAVNACYQLFQQGLAMIPMLIEACFLDQAHEAQDSVKEIEAELLKALLHFGSKEDRLKFLTSLKMALGFLKVLKHKEITIG